MTVPPVRSSAPMYVFYCLAVEVTLTVRISQAPPSSRARALAHSLARPPARSPADKLLSPKPPDFSGGSVGQGLLGFFEGVQRIDAMVNQYRSEFGQP